MRVDETEQHVTVRWIWPLPSWSEAAHRNRRGVGLDGAAGGNRRQPTGLGCPEEDAQSLIS